MNNVTGNDGNEYSMELEIDLTRSIGCNVCVGRSRRSKIHRRYIVRFPYLRPIKWHVITSYMVFLRLIDRTHLPQYTLALTFHTVAVRWMRKYNLYKYM